MFFTSRFVGMCIGSVSLSLSGVPMVEMNYYKPECPEATKHQSSALTVA